MRIPLAAVVAGAVAISCTIPSRRIAQFLMGLSGQTIPDEDGNYWQARLEGSEVVRLEKNPGDGTMYEELRLPLSAFDGLVMGEPLPTPTLAPSEGLDMDKAYLLAGFVGAYREKLIAAGIWTEAEEDDLKLWMETLEEEEREGLFGEEEPSPPAPSPLEGRGEVEADASP